MKTMTIRNVDPTLGQLLKERAETAGCSVNSYVLELLKESLGINKKKRTVKYHDLDFLAGTWDEEQAQEFETAVQPFSEIDTELWK